ncbi:MAG TPA: UDP-glucose/GDP-mannose dehydrogenase family protein [Terriglobia bacterium]|nr:UDP-glucose/GDP-mannose dehydrogenase family protein [Terriglobia bacterium]
MEISVIGAGYVGLTSAACLAELGHNVLCADRDIAKLELLQRGELPFFEPYLAGIVQRNWQAGRLKFTSTEAAVSRNEVIFVCVGTPPLHNGDADLSAVESVARTIARTAQGYRLVIEKSTVPVQTGRRVRKTLEIHSSRRLQFDVASNPEFLREGCAVEDFFHPDRIVAGVESASAGELMREIYKPVLHGFFTCPVHEQRCKPRTKVPLVLTDINSAELIKHASNSFLAMKISFINLIADLCEAAGADVKTVAQGVGLDRRIGSAFLQPGIGFGGSCFPKDVQALVVIAEKMGCDFTLLKDVYAVNRKRIDLFIEKVKRELWVLNGKTIALWGLAFKPDTDDIRFAPSLEVARRLVAEGARVQAYDPAAMANAKSQLPSVTYCENPYQAAESAAAILLVTEWDEFRTVDWERVRAVMERPLMIDGRNMYSRNELASHGFEYIGIGRGVQSQALEPALVCA